MKRLLAALALAILPAVGTAQDQSNTILVLDSSGSMWGQIDGVANSLLFPETAATCNLSNRSTW